MKLLKTVKEVRDWRATLSGSCGFVPTMGALHLGHQSLLERSVAECAATIASIFVNPTQFNDPADFEKYPSTLEADLQMAENAGVDAVFFPSADEIYADAKRFSVDENRDSLPMEGKQRPGHFSGVLTVVLKLLNIVSPDVAYFGEKDFQQYRLIKDMADAFFLGCEIRMCPTVREEDCLAFSSRNVRLGKNARSKAPEFYKAMRAADSADVAVASLESAGFEVEYVEEHWGRRLGAVQLDGVRLIDNLEIEK